MVIIWILDPSMQTFQEPYVRIHYFDSHNKNMHFKMFLPEAIYSWDLGSMIQD